MYPPALAAPGHLPPSVVLPICRISSEQRSPRLTSVTTECNVTFVTKFTDLVQMIVVDTSALVAILLNEPSAADCSAVLALAGQTNGRILMSAGNVTEALVVAGQRGVATEMTDLMDHLGIEVVDVSAATARRVAEAYARWGKGVHPAGLNFGDCFAYALAQDLNCPLLFVGTDFASTDVAEARP